VCWLLAIAAPPVYDIRRLLQNSVLYPLIQDAAHLPVARDSYVLHDASARDTDPYQLVFAWTRGNSGIDDGQFRTAAKQTAGEPRSKLTMWESRSIVGLSC
jgi:hypothetical protein